MNDRLSHRCVPIWQPWPACWVLKGTGGGHRLQPPTGPDQAGPHPLEASFGLDVTFTPRAWVLRERSLQSHPHRWGVPLAQERRSFISSGVPSSASACSLAGPCPSAPPSFLVSPQPPLRIWGFFSFFNRVGRSDAFVVSSSWVCPSFRQARST